MVAAPVLDLRLPETHVAIGDRAMAEHPVAVGRLGRAMAAGLLAAGVQPVGKHAPGHGRARLDSHLTLPTVASNDLDADVLPFALNADLPWAMTAHIRYPGWDPTLPATLSPVIIERVVRGRIGFEGVLVTDDLAMRALSGYAPAGYAPAGAPAALALLALAAGCDLALYCTGEAAPTAELLACCPPVTRDCAARLGRSRALAAGRRLSLDAAALAGERARLLVLGERAGDAGAGDAGAGDAGAGDEGAGARRRLRPLWGRPRVTTACGRTPLVSGVARVHLPARAKRPAWLPSSVRHAFPGRPDERAWPTTLSACGSGLMSDWQWPAAVREPAPPQKLSSMNNLR